VIAQFAEGALGPLVLSSAPTGVLVNGTNSAVMSVSTGVRATCKYGTSDVPYSSMPNTFSVTGGFVHSQTMPGLVSGSNYLYYVRCVDQFANYSTRSTAVSWAVSAVPRQLRINSVGADRDMNNIAPAKSITDMQ
jgi:hypothetical protein